ncbi:beta-1,3-galactosyl-O-glycosyl-glycoprotein beta-1,6-N-acetylglucosaminyltransferase-like [Octopus vulgaris]|uniref:Beta-1,3-galactosyl-O-glycosyl-glycoprotein beta-1,6-N-acetylglucosaminyltransferase-like n=1 Tax=Octopus vulgaris TaxID=6645 RepID=A0AA36BRV6_OCTVU|nr:beta-1,3-galactosyl-O-glycosyl-glycoprotein beta-1,6-N-acetylglucosaminyltransferase-like [Octopus vulgaris]
MLKSEFVRKALMTLSNRKVDSFNCAKIFDNDFQTSPELKEQAKKYPHPAEDLLKLSKNCSRLITERGYFTNSMTIEEESFPIAYGIFFHNQVTQMEQLLRAIYRPQNIYVIHLDQKAAISDYHVAKSIAECFPNVFLSSKRFAIKWGDFSLVEADLVVMRDLLRFSSWRYYINLCGMDFPLKTNLQIVRFLRGLNGKNIVELDFRRWIHRWRKALKQKPVPHNITLAKGSHYVAVTRDFINYTVNNRIAQDLINWLRNTTIPDESVYPTIFYNTHIGSPHPYNKNIQLNRNLHGLDYISSMPKATKLSKIELGKILALKVEGMGTHSHLYKLAKYVAWKGEKPCSGSYKHSVCILGLEDLKHVILKEHLFVNKFERNLAYACMEEWHFNKTCDEYVNLANDMRTHGSYSQIYKLAKYVVWQDTKNKNESICYGSFRRSVCAFGLQDLKRITLEKHLFANKFYRNLPYACLEEWHFNKTRDEYLSLVNNVPPQSDWWKRIERMGLQETM